MGLELGNMRRCLCHIFPCFDISTVYGKTFYSLFQKPFYECLWNNILNGNTVLTEARCTIEVNCRFRKLVLSSGSFKLLYSSNSISCLSWTLNGFQEWNEFKNNMKRTKILMLLSMIILRAKSKHPFCRSWFAVAEMQMYPSPLQIARTTLIENCFTFHQRLQYESETDWVTLGKVNKAPAQNVSMPLNPSHATISPSPIMNKKIYCTLLTYALHKYVNLGLKVQLSHFAEHIIYEIDVHYRVHSIFLV